MTTDKLQMNEDEMELVKAIIEYKPPKFKRSIISRKNTDVDSPDFHDKAKVFCRAVEDVKDIIPKLSLAMNSYSTNFDGIIEAVRENKQGYANLVRLSYAWVDMWSNADETRTDGRNEMSTKLCKEIASAIESKDTDNLLKNGYFTRLDEATLNMHKTSVQSATNLFMRVLFIKDSAARKVLKRKFPDGKVRLRMI